MKEIPKVNQEQVLYRFTSLRAPELLDKTKETTNFVVHPKNLGAFAQAVVNRPEGQTVKQAMIEEANVFEPTALSTEDLRHKYSSQAPVAEWVSRHKYDFSSSEVLDKIAGLGGVSDPGILWDNLFFQMLKQTDYYAKDLVIELLVLKQLMDTQKALIPDPDKFLELLPGLMAATVVIPEDLFPDEPEQVPVSASTDEFVFFDKKSLNMSLDVLLAQSGMEANQKALDEVVALQKEYQTSYQNAYNSAMKIYDQETEAAYAAATMVEKTETECPSGCEIKYFEFENLNLPTFSFTPPKNVDKAWLEEHLTPESFYVVLSLKLENSKTYDAIISGVKSSLAKLNNQLYLNQPSGANVVGVGPMMFGMGSSSAGFSFLASNQIPFTATFEQTTADPIRGKVQLVLDMGYPNANAVLAIYTAVLTTGDVTGESFYDTPNGNMLNLTFFPSPNLEPGTDQTFLLTAGIGMVDGTLLELQCEVPVKNRQTVSGVATIIDINPQDGVGPFIPPKFGIRRLGIGEYKKVVAKVCCYREAEVSNIVNIMDKEFLSRTTTRERIEEVTTTKESSTEKENLTDTTTNERFEMQTEIAKILQQDKQIGAYANVSAHGEGWSADAGGTYATNNAKEESNRQAVIQATEITQRAMERIVTKFRTEVVTKITESFKEENSHIYDNRNGDGHVSGIYRYINAIYKNQIYNYGKRLMYEFMIPEPSRIYRAGMQITSRNVSPAVNAVQLEKPVDPTTLGIVNANSISEYNYLALASRYRAEVEAPIPDGAITGKSFQGKGNTGSFSMEYELKIPKDYQVYKIDYSYSVRKSNPNVNAQLIIGSRIIQIQKLTNVPNQSALGYPLYKSDSFYFYSENFVAYDLEVIPISFTGWDIGSYSFTVTATLIRTPEYLREWQIKTYDAIMKAYQERLSEFNNQVSGAQEDGVKILASNPLFYREIERITLKRNCISYIQSNGYFGQDYYTGTDFKTYQVSQTQPMDDYAAHAKFMEQAFEWDIMSYNFYPYYWGMKDNWQQLYQTENDDPTFRSFMQSGMARVIVSVRPGFEKAVMHYIKFGVIWNGGEMPVIGDPLYLSIVEELKEPEYVVNETWETVVPTSLIGIQQEGVLVNQKGLPCGDGCEGGKNLLVENPNVLKAPKEEPTVEPS